MYEYVGIPKKMKKKVSFFLAVDILAVMAVGSKAVDKSRQVPTKIINGTYLLPTINYYVLSLIYYTVIQSSYTFSVTEYVGTVYYEFNVQCMK